MSETQTNKLLLPGDLDSPSWARGYDDRGLRMESRWDGGYLESHQTGCNLEDGGTCGDFTICRTHISGDAGTFQCGSWSREQLKAFYVERVLMEDEIQHLSILAFPAPRRTIFVNHYDYGTDLWKAGFSVLLAFVLVGSLVLISKMNPWGKR